MQRLKDFGLRISASWRKKIQNSEEGGTRKTKPRSRSENIDHSRKRTFDQGLLFMAWG